MKSFKSPQRVIIILLTSFIVLCCFFIVRLEIKAASLQSQWDEHQKSLKNNEDVLNNLDQFNREIKNNGPEIQLTKNNISLRNELTWFSMDFDKIKAVCDGDISFGNNSNNYFGYDADKIETFLKGNENGTTLIEIENNGPSIELTKKNMNLRNELTQFSMDFDKIKAVCDGDITFGNTSENYFGYDVDKNETFLKGNGAIHMESSNGKCEINMKEKGIEIICKPLKGPIFGISFYPQLQSIDIDAGDASVILAKDEIHFIAEGDINITSKNGNVNIKGKKVKVNE